MSNSSFNIGVLVIIVGFFAMICLNFCFCLHQAKLHNKLKVMLEPKAENLLIEIDNLQKEIKNK